MGGLLCSRRTASTASVLCSRRNASTASDASEASEEADQPQELPEPQPEEEYLLEPTPSLRPARPGTDSLTEEELQDIVDNSPTRSAAAQDALDRRRST